MVLVPRCAQFDHPLNLFFASPIGRDEIEMDPVLELLRVGNPDEKQHPAPIGRHDQALLMLREIRVVGVFYVPEDLRPEL